MNECRPMYVPEFKHSEIGFCSMTNYFVTFRKNGGKTRGEAGEGYKIQMLDLYKRTIVMKFWRESGRNEDEASVLSFFRPPGLVLGLDRRPMLMFYRPAIFFLFCRCQLCPLNFISLGPGLLDILRNINQIEKQHNTFGSRNSPKIHDVIKSAQKRDTLENYF